jgi:hypothetical protein
MGCTNSPIGYAKPDAVTQIANGVSTTTYSYDNNGNLSQKTTDGVTTTYVYDYANRLIALGSQGATHHVCIRCFGFPMSQSPATITSIYPFKRCPPRTPRASVQILTLWCTPTKDATSSFGGASSLFSFRYPTESPCG